MTTPLLFDHERFFARSGPEGPPRFTCHGLILLAREDFLFGGEISTPPLTRQFLDPKARTAYEVGWQTEHADMVSHVLALREEDARR